jgi:hypothetical protein
MPDSPDAYGPTSLPERIDEYARTAEGIVLRGIEHPSCELKRTLALSRENLPDRLDFVKLMQGLANSHAETESLIIIGADQKEERFFDVSNADDFDPARVSPILSKYLFPEPKYVIFNNMKSPRGDRYVLIVLNPIQPRPIVTLVDGEAQGKVRFRPGEIWIKHNTGLKPANRADLDLMYRPRIEQEATKRARIIFEHLKSDLGPELLSQAAESTPTPELLVGSRERLARFAQAMVSSESPARFKMLIEMARRVLVEKWRALMQGSQSPYGVTDVERQKAVEFYRNEYLPTLISSVDLGLEVIKFDGPIQWVGFVAALHGEAFETSRQTGHLEAINQTGDNSLPFARPAYEIYIGARALATYAAARDRPYFLKELLPSYVRPLAPGRSVETLEPLLFWPFSGNLGLPDMRNGRNEELWLQRIGEAWGEAFGSEAAFLAAATQLEFLLELNSYLLIQYSSPASDRFRTHFPEKRTAYLPDFWNTPLRGAIPMAIKVFEALVSRTGFPLELAVEPTVTAAIFEGMSIEDREVFYGEFLSNLRSWQDRTMMQQSRFPFLLSWPPKLQAAVDRYKSQPDRKTGL